MPASEFADRFRATLELYEVGENLLRRERPGASAQDIDDEIAAWLRRRARRSSRSAVVTATVNRVEAALRRIVSDLNSGSLRGHWSGVSRCRPGPSRGSPATSTWPYSSTATRPPSSWSGR